MLFMAILSGMIGLVSAQEAPPPLNDSFSQAVTLPTTLPTFVKGSNIGCTLEVGEPVLNHPWYGEDIGACSAWWKWTAPANGQVLISAVNSKIREGTLVAVYRGNTLATLNLEGIEVVDFYYEPSPNPGVLVEALAGQTYFIAVHGLFESQGTFDVVVVQPPLNDSFTDAGVLGSAIPVTVSGTNVGATAEEEEPKGPNSQIHPFGQTVWWQWQSPISGLVQIDTLGSSFDTQLHIYTGAAIEELEAQASNRNANDIGNSRTAFQAQAGMLYWIQITGEEPVHASGLISLNIRSLENPVTANDYVARGRAFLQQQTMAGIAAATQQFQLALGVDPAHPEASVLLAVGKLTLLEPEPAFAQALSAIGLVDSDLYARKYRIAKDLDGKLVVPLESHTQKGLEYLQTILLPELQHLKLLLAAASQPSFLMSLSDSETSSSYVVLDAGDISIIMASVYGLEAMIRLLQTYDAGFSVAEVVTAANEGKLEVEALVDSFSNLLTQTSDDQRGAFKAALKAAASHYLAASTHVRTVRSSGAAGQHHLFRLATDFLTEEETLRGYVQKGVDSLDGPVNVVVDGNNETVDLSSLFSSSHSLRDQLPRFHGNQVVEGTVADPTFKGTVSTANQERVSTLLRDRNLLYTVRNYTDWAGHFLRKLPEQDRLPGTDPDNDMLGNFAEYAFGLDPAKFSSPGEFIVSKLQRRIENGKNYLHITFPRRILSEEIEYSIEVSADLREWDGTEIQVERVGDPLPLGNGKMEQVTYRLLAEAEVTGKKFLRVKVRQR